MNQTNQTVVKSFRITKEDAKTLSRAMVSITELCRLAIKKEVRKISKMEKTK